MRYIRGFLMAWGCFCWIPCPYRKWNEDDRPAMLAMLPLVGTFIGAITGLVWWGMILLGVGKILTGALVTAVYFLLTGFIHLDGYMDCCDAVLPRHPDPKRRREILKDPHVGAFGVIGLVLMIVLFVASIGSITDSKYLHPVILMSMIATTSRAGAAIDVLSKTPMETSQYDKMAAGRPGRKYQSISGIICCVVFAIGYQLFMMGTEPIIEGEYVIVDFTEMLSLPVVAVVTLAVCACVGALDRRALGGMNGDIAGHMIVTGEMFGMLAAALTLL